MAGIIYADESGPFFYDEDDIDMTAGNWFEKIYRDVSEYLADQIETDITRPRRMPVRIDETAAF